MKNGSESVVRSSAQDLKKYPSKPSVPSLVQQWQRKAVSLVEDAWRGAATALLAPRYAQQKIAIAPNAIARNKRHNKKSSF